MTSMRDETERRMVALDQVARLLTAGVPVGDARDQVAVELGETSRTLLNWQPFRPIGPGTSAAAASEQGAQSDAPAPDRSVALPSSQGDRHPADRYGGLFVRWDDGTVSCPIVLTAQDVFSRKVVASVCATPRTAMRSGSSFF